ncbi:MAG: 16S rRNA (cytidine(1402)-2'-O)-methyltransferase [Candidatus Omnitrophica bacterium]|nr:16S rRNA (cytidine(1402)-2'-O)-methyltransferase [Candidatus Omnitrophota bacterium]
MPNAVLHLVATPIGNLGDMSERAVETLKSVTLIAAEDTRRTKILCNRFGIRTPLESYHDFSDERKRERVLSMLESGNSIALVSDGGTPLISDPGFKLVRAAIERGISVSAVPGPSAVIVALTLSGFPTDRFMFEGFLPVKSGERKRRLGEIKEERRTVIYFESPYRLLKSLEDIQEALGGRSVCVAKELTKQFEETFRGTAGEIKQELGAKSIKGEYVIVIKGHDR